MEDKKRINYGARISHCVKMLKPCLELDGHVAECGVAGGSVTFALDKHTMRASKKVYAFDTFEGLPHTEGKALIKGRFSDLHPLFWNRLDDLKLSTSIVPVKGMVEDTLHLFDDKRFCFVWLDMDLEDSTRFAYGFFKDRMSAGGIIGFHDYGFAGCPGIEKVVAEEVDFTIFEEVFRGDFCLFIKRR